MSYHEKPECFAESSVYDAEDSVCRGCPVRTECASRIRLRSIRNRNFESFVSRNSSSTSTTPSTSASGRPNRSARTARTVYNFNNMKVPVATQAAQLIGLSVAETILEESAQLVREWKKYLEDKYS